MKTTKAVGVLVFAVAGCMVAAGAAGQATGPATQPATQPAKELTLDLGNKVTMKLVLIPAGKFTMGSPKAEQELVKNQLEKAGIKGIDFSEEGPQHEVTISNPFYMGATHVTVDQFATFVKDSGYKTDAEKEGWSVGFEIKDGKIDLKKMDGASWRKPSFDQKGDHPVVQVSWNDAKAFCDWLSKNTGKTVMLPTEAQWEYACRAGAKTAYPWGASPDDGKGWANCRDQSLKKKLPNAAAGLFFSWDDGFEFTSPAGSFKANAFGLYDMIGNAYQWCSDWYDKDYYANAKNTDPQGPTSGTCRVLRGGGWSDNPRNCRSAIRIYIAPDYRFDYVGFRVAVDLK